jgi:deoxyribodipyrimidine photo-lyase
VAGTGTDAAPYFRVFNPITQSEKFDPTGSFIRSWVPELAEVPDAWIHRPWDAGPLELVAYGVELGRNYPNPIVDHGPARDRAIAAYETARGSR